MVRFIVLSTQRSGSTFLITCLGSHPRIYCYQEVFHTYPDPENYVTYRKASFDRRIRHIFWRKQLINRYLEDLYSAPSNVDALGFKLMYGQAAYLPQVVEWLKENNVHVIHLIRNNILKRIVSKEIRKIRKLAHSTEPVELVKVSLNPWGLKRRLKSRSRQIETYRKIFADNPYTEVTYESFVDNRDDESRRLLQFLGINSFQPLTSSLVKLNPDSLMTLIKNYEEIARILKGTYFEKLLD